MIGKRFEKAWNQADVTLTASRFMGEAKTTVASTGTAVSGNYLVSTHPQILENSYIGQISCTGMMV